MLSCAEEPCKTLCSCWRPEGDARQERIVSKLYFVSSYTYIHKIFSNHKRWQIILYESKYIIMYVLALFYLVSVAWSPAMALWCIGVFPCPTWCCGTLWPAHRCVCVRLCVYVWVYVSGSLSSPTWGPHSKHNHKLIILNLKLKLQFEHWNASFCWFNVSCYPANYDLIDIDCYKCPLRQAERVHAPFSHV